MRTILLAAALLAAGISALAMDVVVAPGPDSFTGTLGVANGGTGGVTAAAARSSLSAAALGVNTDITKLNGSGTIALTGGVGGSTVAYNGPACISTAPVADQTSTCGIQVNLSGQTTFGISLSSFMVSGALSGTFAGTALGVCVTGSTVSINIPVGISRIAGWFRGSVANGTLAKKIILGIVVDGAFVDGETTTRGEIASLQAVATDNQNMTFPFLLTGLTAGSHSVCLAGMVDAGTATIDSTDSLAKLAIYALP